MNINVNSIINNIESALRASSSKGNTSEEVSVLPRAISPEAKKNKKNPELVFNGKQLIGRMYVDGNGVPFRSLTWVSSIFLPYLTEEGFWRARNIRVMSASNYVDLTEGDKKLIRALENKMREYKTSGIISPYDSNKPYKAENHEPIYSLDRENVLFYFKPQMVLSNGVQEPIPELAPGSYVLTRKSGLLQQMLSSFQSENQMNGSDWADDCLSRTGLNRMSIVLSAAYLPATKSYSWTFNFKPAKPVELTAEDLEAATDLNNEFIPNVLDAERAEADLKFLEEQFEIRQKMSTEGFDSVVSPDHESSKISDFEPVSGSIEAPDKDILF